ncbi:hypothetical protein M8J76_008423 [Diaphorina citri]|nr:hypothetical protein M8J76_008423 [Diaphorina citri]
MSLSLLPKLKFVTGDSVRSELDSFKRKFENFLIVNKSDNESDRIKVFKVAYLQLAVSNECLELIQISEVDSVEDVFKKLEEALLPKENIILNQFKFFQRKQEFGESVDDFINDLKKLVKSCQFDEQEANILKKVW